MLCWRSTRFFTSALVAMSVLGAVACATAGPTVVLVRHAEKADDSKDPPLTEKGRERADSLVRLLGRTDVDAIYSSEYERTQATVAPLAAASGLRTEVISAREPEVLLETLRNHAPDDVIVVSGHSNTLPAMLSELGAANVPTIEHHEYDRVFLVTLRGNSPPIVVELAFGAVSEPPTASMPTNPNDGVSPVPENGGEPAPALEPGEGPSAGGDEVVAPNTETTGADG